jgi:predicted  nucleic acid-binding Zn-ribbon protein
MAQATHRLLDLQTLDSAIDRLVVRQRGLEVGDDLAAARKTADEAETTLGELRLQLDVFDRDGAKLEHEIDSLSQKAAAEETRMYDGSVANAKELDAIRHEVENLARRKSDREDELLALLEQRETVERRAKEAEATSTDLRSGVEHVAADAGEELARVRSELQDLRAQKTALIPEIDPEVLELYEELRPHKKGVGAAALVDGVCQGCHEQLSSVELDRVKHSGELARCDHCRRILVL